MSSVETKWTKSENHLMESKGETALISADLTVNPASYQDQIGTILNAPVVAKSNWKARNVDT